MKHTKKILIVGGGYVGLAYTCFFAQKHHVTVLDSDASKVDDLNQKNKISDEKKINNFLKKYQKNITATTNIDCFAEFDLALMCLPTDYDETTNYFDTSILTKMLSKLHKKNFNGIVAIKSTVPFGFTENICKKYKQNIIFSPEFLREGSTLPDILNPSRVVAGGDEKLCKTYIEYIGDCIEQPTECLTMTASESEAVKLFSNTYLAMRVSFFNELDSFCAEKKINSKNIIDAVCLDKRIGDHYNNPSFGYGGYCLPKDTKQLLANYDQVPQNLIGSIVMANETRKDFIVNLVLAKKIDSIGVYRLVMKKGSDNIRESSIIDIVKKLKSKGKKIFIYEPSISENNFLGCEVLGDLNDFLNKSKMILTNRYDDNLNSHKSKVLTRDIYLKE